MARYGITIPFDGAPLHEQRDWIAELSGLGYTDVWSAESQGADGFTPLALASEWGPDLRLGVAIVPAYTRGPATLAMCVATMAAAAPGRFVFGIGTSSDVIVQRWNDIPFEEPYKKVRDTIRFLRKALTGEKVTEEYDTFSVKGFRLGLVPPEPPPIVVGALRPGMLKLAVTEGDGAITNWLSAEDVKQVREHAGDKELVARIFVAPTTDTDAVYGMGKYAISAYLNVPVYREFHRWLGRTELEPMWKAWADGDRKAALAAIPDSVVDELIVHGPPEACREHVQRYVDNGIDTTAIALLPLGYDVRQAIRDMAPAKM
jgi:probable F420-dependent oxidoreductase